ncbi:MAG TPA: amidohydrolase family protein, partial [Edaphocola sp.]|nr:amidohydrolase family protein [Edaphocola sp.]
LLVENGLTPFEALETGTVNAAKTMEQNDWGMIKENFRANLVLLDENPLENIENTQKIFGVFKDGKYYSKDDIAKKLKDIYTYRQNNDRLITPMEGR